MQKITPCLWFDSNAEEAVKFYTSIFKKSKIRRIARYTEEGYEIHGRPAGTVMTIEFELNGQTFTALNGGPVFRFNEAISFQVNCKSQEELDYYWEKLSKGGDEKAQQCGWLKDKYGVSWQIVPTVLGEMLQGKDTEISSRIMKALLQMKKLDIKTLKQAYGQKYADQTGPRPSRISRRSSV
jgi:predicted 3-demethylubiquinone-9 3-methyltransferase (glyoxalase superfamily)